MSSMSPPHRPFASSGVSVAALVTTGSPALGHLEGERRGRALAAGDDVGEPVERRQAEGDEEDPEQPEQGQSRPEDGGHGLSVGSRRARVNDRLDSPRPLDIAGARAALSYHEWPVDPTRSPLRGMSYTQARRLLVAVGVGVLGVLALVMYARRVETIEVLAVLLFVPVFLALAALGPRRAASPRQPSPPSRTSRCAPRRSRRWARAASPGSSWRAPSGTSSSACSGDGPTPTCARR